jgi:UDP-GlcNAc:undecaprenyl-phosphate GlcNAc-1-phosphate transferase
MVLWFVLAVISAALVRVMIKVGALDHPVARSSHAVPTPKGGGVGIATAYALGTAWLLYKYKVPATAAIPLCAALLLAAVSYVDDVRAGPFGVKLAAQAVAAVAVMFAGDQLNKVYVGGQLIDLPSLLRIPLTFVLLLFVTNAVNFADGLNGLASGCVGVAGLALATQAAAGAAPGLGGGALGEQAMPLVAGIAGFLPFNYPRARIFMGDVGSQLCGFVAADLAVRAAASPASLIVPLALVPVLADVAFTLVRRMLAGDRLTEAHRGHLYQIANRSGVGAANVTAVYWGMAAWGAVCGVLAGGHGGGLVAGSAWGVIGLAPMVAWFGYVVRTAKRAGITRW